MHSRFDFKPSPITLGTVQLGTAYGIANTAGQPTEAQAFAILDKACELGITTFDTARNYGTAEQLIGKWLASRRPQGVHIVTKVPPIPPGSDVDRRRFVREQIAASRRSLGTEQLALVLTHEETDLLDPANADEFTSALADGSIAGFGASTYHVSIAEKLIATVPLAALQVPASIADRRFEEAGVFRTASDRGIAVFARSVFLQGLLLMSPERLPGHLSIFAPILAALANASQHSGRSIMELLIAAVRDTPGVTSLVIGADSEKQLGESSKALTGPPLPRDVREDLAHVASRIPAEMLIPSNWSHSADNT